VWYWLQDGFLHDGNLYNFPMVIEKNPEAAPGFQFRTRGVRLLKIPLAGGTPQLAAATSSTVGLYADEGGGRVFFGAGVLAGEADGFVYVYGRRHQHFRIDLVVARVLPSQVADTSAWRFWHGDAWGADISKSASLGPGGPELSVTRMNEGLLNGKYLLVTMPISRDVFIRVGDTRWGPFGEKTTVFRTPEPDVYKGAYTYNAKAHPALSSNGRLLVSYNVNAPSLVAHKKQADIYRPRFFWLSFR
jgi:hypothetical protein